MKNKLLTAILLLVLPLFITACSARDIPIIGALFGGKVVPQKEVTLKFWGLWESPEVMNSVALSYNEQNPKITISYDDRSIIKPSQHKETVIARLSEEGAPDIVLIHNSWVPELSGLLAPAPPGLIDVAGYTQKFYPIISESAVIQGKIYAAPAYYDGLALVYNIDHFDEIDQVTPPTAWEEFRRLALSLTIKDEEGSFIRSGAAIGAADNIDFFSDILGLMFAQAGVVVPEDLDSKPAQDALSFYTMFVNEDKIWDSTLPEASSAFTQEKVSMIFVPSWGVLDIIRTRPDLKVGVAAVPQALPDNPVSWGSFWMFAVAKNSSNQKEAWEFINYLTQNEQQLKIFDLASRYRPFGAPYASVELASQVSETTSGKYIKPILDTASFAKSGVLAGRAGNITQTDALGSAINALTAGQEHQRPGVEEVLTIAKTALTSQ
ncbi:ABC transporter substrate-binding protein [Patescibacteria group bacterium]